MPIAINGSGTVTGVSVGGLPDGIVDTDMIADGAATGVKNGAGRVLQVVQGGSNAVSSASVNGGSLWESTGINVTITPSNSSNKILLIASVNLAVTGPQNNQGIILRKGGSTLTAANAAAAGSRMTLMSAETTATNDSVNTVNFNYLDTAGSSGSGIQYRCDLYNPSSITRTSYINRSVGDSDNAYQARCSSWIVAMEIKV